MKKIILTMFIASTCLALNAQNFKQAIKLNPLSLFLSTGNVSYEHKISEGRTVQLGAFYSGVKVAGIKYSGLGVTPEFRLYFSTQKNLSGVYVAPFGRFQSFTLQNVETKAEAKYTSIGGGATLGWQKAWKSHLVLDLYAGPAYNAGKVRNDNPDDTFDVSANFTGTGVRAGISLGFAF